MVSNTSDLKNNKTTKNQDKIEDATMTNNSSPSTTAPSPADETSSPYINTWKPDFVSKYADTNHSTIESYKRVTAKKAAMLEEPKKYDAKLEETRPSTQLRKKNEGEEFEAEQVDAGENETSINEEAERLDGMEE